MSNTLTLSDQPVEHPQSVLRGALRNGTPTELFERANSYTTRRGKEPGEAWLLMLRSHINQLNKNAFHTIKWKDTATSEVSIGNLSIVKSFSVSRALAGDLDAPRLVHLQDERKQLAMSSINAQYNIRIPAPSTTSGTGLYYTASLDSGSLWTWQTLVDDIWGNLPTIAGTAPTLPYTPDGTPEGFRFIGTSAWDALHVVLEKVTCDTSYNPFTGVLSYVRLGTTQTGLAAVQTGLSDRIVFNFDPEEDYQLAQMPETVRVFFARRDLYHGIELDTPDTSNWEMTPAESKDRATGITGAVAGSVMVVWDDLPALFDSAGSNSNSAALQTRADEIGDNIRDRINVSDERERFMYSGLVDAILPGSEVSQVTWSDFGSAFGLTTETVSSPVEPILSDVGNVLSEHLETLDLARNTHPLWPRVAQWVQADDGATTTGDNLSANGDNLYPGFVIRYVAGTYSQLDACWIRPGDLEPGASPSETDVIAVRQKDRFAGRLYGIQTSGGDTRPVYIVRQGGTSTATKVRWGVATANWTQNTAPTCHTITVQECDDCEGNNAAGATLTLKFPRDPSKDPNAITSNVISFEEDDNGDLIALSHLDEAIGSVEQWALSLGSIKQGWAAMDGSSNATIGSGINVNSGASDGGGRFVKGSSTAGTTGGEQEHTHDLTVDIDANVFITGFAQAINIDVEDHTTGELSHNHGLTEDTPGTAVCWEDTGVEDACPPLECTGPPVELEEGLSGVTAQTCASADPWGPLNHTVNISSSGGGFEALTEAFVNSTLTSADHTPEHVTLIWIERIDNSV